MAKELPLRYPDTSSREFMTRRAWWLLGANFLIPGAGSTLAGNRRFGRFMLRFWLFNLTLFIIAAIMWFVLRGPLMFAFSTTLGLSLLAIYLFVVGALWALSTVDTLRLTRLIKIDPYARGLVAMIAIVCMMVPFFAAAWASALTNQAKGLVTSLFGGPSAGVTMPANGRYNILLLGGDSGADRQGRRPDSISVMSFDAMTGSLVTIGVPRNLERFSFADGPMKDYYGGGLYEKCDVDVCYLNSVYTEVEVYHQDFYPDAEARGSTPGIEATREAVEGITGLDIPYYAMVDMQGFADLIDALGGVDIEVKERVGLGINDDGSPGWEPPSTYIEPGMQHMDGEIALWYARSRYESTDFARMERQRQLQEAIIQKFTPANISGKIGPVSQAISKVVTTDLPEGMAGVFADLALKSRSAGSQRLDLVPPMINIENPDLQFILGAVQNTLQQDPKATPTPTDGSAPQSLARDPEDERAVA